MRTAVGVNKTVNTEASVVGEITEITAVGVLGLCVNVLTPCNGMVDELPNAAAEEAVVGIDEIPVHFKISRAVTHCVAILAKKDGHLALFIVKIVFKKILP